MPRLQLRSCSLLQLVAHVFWHLLRCQSQFSLHDIPGGSMPLMADCIWTQGQPEPVLNPKFASSHYLPVWSRHLLERIEFEAFRLRRPRLADELVGRETLEGFGFANEVVGGNEVDEMGA